jgi:hypothetical protein
MHRYIAAVAVDVFRLLRSRTLTLARMRHAHGLSWIPMLSCVAHRPLPSLRVACSCAATAARVIPVCDSRLAVSLVRGLKPQYEASCIR